jgi:hypothetical protein
VAQTTEIDIRTKFIGGENKVYIVFPGAGYKFYNTFREQGVIFLDLPGFPAPKEAFSNAEDILARLVVSERIREWHAKGAPSHAPPARKPEELTEYRETQRRRQFSGQIRNFYGSIRRGDVIVVPPANYEQSVLFGEVSDYPNNYVMVKTGTTGEEIPARKVIWRAQQPRQAVPGWLDHRLPNQKPG